MNKKYQEWSDQQRDHNRLYQKLYKRRKRKEQGLPVIPGEQNTRGGAAEWWARQTPRVRSVFAAIREDEPRKQGQTSQKPPLTFEQSQTLHDWVDSVVMDTEMEED